MVTRIRRSRTDTVDSEKLVALMKSISKSQDAIDNETKAIKTATLELYSLMKQANKTIHSEEGLIATLFRPAGRATRTIDPKGFRRLVKDDKEFYSCISISVTAATKVLPEKQLATITTTVDAKPGEETVKVSRG